MTIWLDPKSDPPKKSDLFLISDGIRTSVGEYIPPIFEYKDDNITNIDPSFWIDFLHLLRLDENSTVIVKYYAELPLVSKT